MKTKPFYSIIFIAFVGFYASTCMAQTHPFYPFLSAIDNETCITNWKDAGSATHRAEKHPYIIINAIEDWGLSTVYLSDNSQLFEKGLEKLRKDFPSGLIVIYFPSGFYYFKSYINLTNYKDIILKGENGNSQLVAHHSGTGIYLNGCERIGIEDLTVTRTKTCCSTC